MNVFFLQITITTETELNIPSTIFQKFPSELFCNIQPWLKTDKSKIWLLPACIQSRWCVVAVDYQRKEITQYYSIFHTRKCSRRVRNIIKNSFQENYKIHNRQPVIQKNGYDCGVITIDFARQLEMRTTHIEPHINRIQLKEELRKICNNRGDNIIYTRFYNDLRTYAGSFPSRPTTSKLAASLMNWFKPRQSAEDCQVNRKTTTNIKNSTKQFRHHLTFSEGSCKLQHPSAHTKNNDKTKKLLLHLDHFLTFMIPITWEKNKLLFIINEIWPQWRKANFRYAIFIIIAPENYPHAK